MKVLSSNYLSFNTIFFSPSSTSSTSFYLILHLVILTTSSLLAFSFCSSWILSHSSSICSWSISLEFLNMLSWFGYIGIWIQNESSVFWATRCSLSCISHFNWLLSEKIRRAFTHLKFRPCCSRSSNPAEQLYTRFSTWPVTWATSRSNSQPRYLNLKGNLIFLVKESSHWNTSCSRFLFPTF